MGNQSHKAVALHKEKLKVEERTEKLQKKHEIEAEKLLRSLNINDFNKYVRKGTEELRMLINNLIGLKAGSGTIFLSHPARNVLLTTIVDSAAQEREEEEREEEEDESEEERERDEASMLINNLIDLKALQHGRRVKP